MAAERFPPYEYIIEEATARGWSLLDALDRLGWDVLDYAAPITPEMAEDLEHVFGVSRVFWLNLEQAYRQSQPRLDLAAERTEET